MFRKICKMSQKDLKKFVAAKLKETYDKVIVDDGYVYAQGSFPVLLVAHLDTVHPQLPQMFVYDTETDALSSPQGIGGDDRCGVYMILKIIKKYNCSVLFCEDEESGGIGATKFTKTKLAETLEFNYILEFDRQGSDDAVFYDCDNEEFEEFITKEYYRSSWGTFSDISILAPYFGCAAVNLSCGYYKPHTKNEYVVLSEMDESIYAACEILERTTESDKFDYIEAKRSRWDDWYDDYCQYFVEYRDKETKETKWEQVYASSQVEAVGKFCMNHPNIPYADIEVYRY